MMMKQADHFLLLGMPAIYGLDLQQLDVAYRELQARVHPDKFATASEQEKRLAMQSSAQVNEAYKTLRDPLRRAAYLCELQGEPVKAERHAQTMPREFLMQQMHWREALAEAREAGDGDAMQALHDTVAAAQRAGYAKLSALLDAQRDYTGAAAQVRALMFIDKFAQDVNDALDGLSV